MNIVNLYTESMYDADNRNRINERLYSEGDMFDVELYDAIIANYQLQSIIEEIELDRKFYGESVGAFFAAIVSFVLKAIAFVIKVILGSKLLIVGIITYILYKIGKLKSSGNQTHAFGGGGGLFSTISDILTAARNSGKGPLYKLGIEPPKLTNDKLSEFVNAVKNNPKYKPLSKDKSKLRKDLKDYMLKNSITSVNDASLSEMSDFFVKQIRLHTDKNLDTMFVAHSELLESCESIINTYIDNNIKKYDEDIKVKQLYVIDGESVKDANEKLKNLKGFSRTDDIADAYAEIIDYSKNILLNITVHNMVILNCLSKDIDNIQYKDLLYHSSGIRKYKNEVLAAIEYAVKSKDIRKVNNIKSLVLGSRIFYTSYTKNKTDKDNASLYPLDYIFDVDSKYIDIVKSLKVKPVNTINDLNAGVSSIYLYFKSRRGYNDSDSYDFGNISFGDASGEQSSYIYSLSFAEYLRNLIVRSDIDINDLKAKISEISDTNKMVRDEISKIKDGDSGIDKAFIQDIIKRDANAMNILFTVLQNTSQIVGTQGHPIYDKIMNDVAYIMQAYMYLEAKNILEEDE